MLYAHYELKKLFLPLFPSPLLPLLFLRSDLSVEIFAVRIPRSRLLKEVAVLK
jgi:hypothetical protein